MQSTLGNPNTLSETLFEQYLKSHGHGDWSHEQPVAGKPTTPDYCLQWLGSRVFFDVKEWKGKPVTLETIDLQSWDTIREKITQAGRQFKHYREHACAIVLSNPHRAPISLDEDAICGAMFGDVKFLIQVDTDQGDVRSVEKALTRNGKMGNTQNKTFSAVVVLDRFETRRRLSKSNTSNRRNLVKRRSIGTCSTRRPMSMNNRFVSLCMRIRMLEFSFHPRCFVARSTNILGTMVSFSHARSQVARL